MPIFAEGSPELVRRGRISKSNPMEVTEVDPDVALGGSGGAKLSGGLA